MSIADIQNEIERIKSAIADLPIGYISRKIIQGKERYYRQWTEHGKIKSKYIRESEIAVIMAQIAHRKELQSELNEIEVKSREYQLIQAISPHKKYVLHESGSTYETFSKYEYETNVVLGDSLAAMAESVRGWEERDCFHLLNDYIISQTTDRVCLIYGLRRTGKTTLIRQAMLKMSEREMSRAVYIKATASDSMASLNKDLKKLAVTGYKYVFIDEVTLICDFVESAALLSDIYAAQGMKIVLSGTDSLGFWFALHQELYDRALMIHTTFIPFREHSRLLNISCIDEYIHYGGTLRAGETDFDDHDLTSDEASFRDNESTRRYIDSAICKNIQHSLACCEDGGHFRHLRTLYEAGELTGAINRIIEDMNHNFLISVLTDEFVSHDLGVAARNLRKERKTNLRTDILDQVNTVSVTQRLMEILEIRNCDDLSVSISQAHIEEIKEYLKALDLIEDCPVETTIHSEPIEHILFTQPGMRYCQAQALVHSLMKDSLFVSLSEYKKKQITDRILEEVRGRIMEEIVLLETSKALSNKFKVFKLFFSVGEFDMVIYDTISDSCAVFEIKHCDIVVPEQYRHLVDVDKCRKTESRFGKILHRYVIYRGAEHVEKNGIKYLNVGEYLNSFCGMR